MAAFRERFHAAWNDHDVDTLMTMLTDDIVWIDPTREQPVIGSASVREFLAASFRTFPDLHFVESDPPHLSGDGVHVACAWVMEGTMHGSFEPQGFAATRRRMRVPGVDLWVMRDGRIALYRTFYDVTTVARQLGIMPMPDTFAERAFVVMQRVQAAFQRRRR